MTRVFAKEDTEGVTETPFLAPEMPDALTAPAAEPEEPLERPYTPAEGLDPEAPYGYTIDRKTGDKRPRKRAGRGVRVVKAEELPAGQGAPKAAREPDRVPGRVKPEEPRARRTRERAAKPEPEPLPVFRAGPIAKGVNRLYRKGGKILKVWDAEIGQALVECTRKDIDPETGEPDPEDTTVGEAWEEIAKVNPRIRRILLRLIEGGAWGALFMAHAPILIAILTKESVLRRLPLARLMTAFMDDDDDGAGDGGTPDLGGLLASLTPEDMAQAAAMFNQFAPSPGRTTTADFYAAQRRPMPNREAVYEDLPLPEDADAPA